MKGRKRLPTVVKKSRGTLQPCRTNPNEPDYILVKELPDPPDWLNEDGKKIYYDTAEDLLKQRILTRISYPVFLMYCVEISKYFEASKQLKKTSMVYKSSTSEPKVNPWQRVANDSLSNSLRIASEFGLTPASSSKIDAEPIKDEKMLALEKMMKE